MFVFVEKLFSVCQIFELGPQSKLLAAESDHARRHEICLTRLERVKCYNLFEFFLILRNRRTIFLEKAWFKVYKIDKYLFISNLVYIAF